MATRSNQHRQEDHWIATGAIVETPWHAFHTKLNQLLSERRFDELVEHLCRRSMLRCLKADGLVRGKTIGIDASTLEANAAMRSIMQRDTGASYDAHLTTFAQAVRIAEPTRGELARFDHKPSQSRNGSDAGGRAPAKRTRERSSGRSMRIGGGSRVHATSGSQAKRAELNERSNAHLYEPGGMRRVHLRGREIIPTRLLLHGAGFNLALIMRSRYGIGKPRGLQGRSFVAVSALGAPPAALGAIANAMARLFSRFRTSAFPRDHIHHTRTRAQ